MVLDRASPTPSSPFPLTKRKWTNFRQSRLPSTMWAGLIQSAEGLNIQDTRLPVKGGFSSRLPWAWDPTPPSESCISPPMPLACHPHYRFWTSQFAQSYEPIPYYTHIIYIYIYIIYIYMLLILFWRTLTNAGTSLQ